jgi:hypothetical protein
MCWIAILFPNTKSWASGRTTFLARNAARYANSLEGCGRSGRGEAGSWINNPDAIAKFIEVVAKKMNDLRMDPSAAQR